MSQTVSKPVARASSSGRRGARAAAARRGGRGRLAARPAPYLCHAHGGPHHYHAPTPQRQRLPSSQTCQTTILYLMFNFIRSYIITRTYCDSSLYVSTIHSTQYIYTYLLGSRIRIYVYDSPTFILYIYRPYSARARRPAVALVLAARQPHRHILFNSSLRSWALRSSPPL
jgi:hypothetical protein